MTKIRPGFTGSLLDRLDEARHDEAKVAAMRAEPEALLLRLDGLDPHIAGEGLLDWCGLDEAVPEHELALLGRIDGVPRFVSLTPGVSALSRSAKLFEAITMLRPGEAGTYAAARSLIDWHARHGFCANCGTKSEAFRAGWGRRCSTCSTEHFPRVDPVVIMLAQHGAGAEARVLVGRQGMFPPGRYSALAGFLEPGESIEEAVARELFEEAGVVVSRVRYVASQPWPFPSQLMIACVAEVESDTLNIDRNELEDAKWVDREGVASAMRREAAWDSETASLTGAPFLPPPPYAIAHSLFEHWLAEI